MPRTIQHHSGHYLLKAVMAILMLMTLLMLASTAH